LPVTEAECSGGTGLYVKLMHFYLRETFWISVQCSVPLLFVL